MNTAAPLTSMISVYVGRHCVGFILKRGLHGFEAFDAEQQSLGIFVTQQAAADAVSKRVPK